MNDQHIGIGQTKELSLRISVATLTRVIFPHPEDETPMLALEHKANIVSKEEKSRVIVKVQPFGGAIRILDTNKFLELVGKFNFDSERSRSEEDFRGYIRPSAWEEVRDFCLQNLSLENSSALETDPFRELEEEFEDTLGTQLNPEQYSMEFLRIVVENQPAPTANVHAPGTPTVRIYRIDEVNIHDSELCKLMIANSQSHPRPVMKRLAREDAKKGDRGRANAMLVAPLARVRNVFLSVQPEQRGTPRPFGGTILEGNVAAVLDGVPVKKYEPLG